MRRPRRRDPHRPRHGLEILPAQQTQHHLTLAPGREPTPTAAPGGRAGRPRFLNVLPHLDTPPARTLSQSSVQENPRAQELLHEDPARSGRPGSLLTLAPHRSGRAGSAASGSSTDSFATRRRVPAGPGSQAMATAIPKACLASSAIRCRDVETGPNLGVLAVFPSTGATCRGPLPSTGSRGLNSPASAVPYETRRLLAVTHPPEIKGAFARSIGTSRAPAVRSVGRCGRLRRPRPRRRFGEPVPAPRRSLRWRRRGAPGFPGNPPARDATRSDPVVVARSPPPRRL